MSSGAACGPGARDGVTLLELLVVLLLLALGAALVAPALRLPAGGGRDVTPVDPVAEVVDAARDLALRRAEALTVTVASDGGWRVEPAHVSAIADTAALLAGRLAWSPGGRALRVVVSPVGTCVPDVPNASDVVWDAAWCRPAEPLLPRPR